MKKYPFWVIKADAKRLLRGKWKPLVLSLFIPFLLFAAFNVYIYEKIDALEPASILGEKYLFYVQVASLIFSVVMQLLTVGIYENLKPSREKANFFLVYGVACKKIWKMLPTLFVTLILPNVITFWLSSDSAIRFYDYLLFSVLDYHVYLIVVTVVINVIQILAFYLQCSLVLVPAITVEHPEFGGLHLMKESFAVTKGSRIYLLMLSISFVGWLILGSLALYIGILWAMLYMLAANYAYYRRITIIEEPITVSDISES